MKKLRIFLLLFMLMTVLLYLLTSYVFWDYHLLRNVEQWHPGERFVLLWAIITIFSISYGIVYINKKEPKQ